MRTLRDSGSEDFGLGPGAYEGSDRWDPHFVQWVIKSSKRCNLRCAYCYEFPSLGDSARMTFDQLERMFTHVGAYYAGAAKRMDFVWHGGEPLLLRPAFYQRVEELQHKILDPREVPFTNSVQTNLTLLNEGILNLFRSFFTNVGVSLDLFGDQRVNTKGKPVQDKVLENMQRLEDEHINFGCITVLSRLTAPHVEEIYDFFVAINKSFRLLPIYRIGYEGQQDSLELTPSEIVSALRRVVDRWFASDAPIQVFPITDYVANVVRYLDGGAGVRVYYNKLDGEVVYIIDTDGSVYSNADAYDPKLCHGNIFRQSLEEINKSSGKLRAVRAADRRLQQTCNNCRYLGACWGYYAAEATPQQRWEDSTGHMICGVAEPMHRYIEDLLRKAGVVDTERNILLREELLQRIQEAGGARSP